MILRPKEFGVLLYLIENRGRFVSRDDLFDEFFLKDDPDKVVFDSNVHTTIHNIRRALGVKGGDDKYIKTVGHTYRFVAKNLVVDGEPDGAEEPDKPVPEPFPATTEPGQPAAEPPAAFEEAPPVTQPGTANVVAGPLKEADDEFKKWLFGEGRWPTALLLIWIVLTLALSVVGIRQQWPLTSVLVSGAQALFLLAALFYRSRGPNVFLSPEELTPGGVLNEKVRRSTGYETAREWSNASEVAVKSLKRFKLYWGGALFAWLLLYFCLIFVAHPSLDLNCRIDTSRFCASNLTDPIAFAVAFKDDKNPLSTYLRDLLPNEARQELNSYVNYTTPPESLQHALLDEINQRLSDCCLYSEARFPAIKLPEGERAAVGTTLKGEGLVEFNRSLLMKVFPLHPTSEGEQWGSIFLNLLNTLLNNCTSLMIVLCFNILNKPMELKGESRDINDTSWLTGAAVVLVFTVAEILFVMSQPDYGKYQVLKWGGGLSGIFGGVAMALYFGRLQSKFLGPRQWVLVTLYCYTAIQALFVILEERRDEAVALIDGALILKCLLFLYIAWLFHSGRLLFYFVRVRRTYRDVIPEWEVFQEIIKTEN